MFIEGIAIGIVGTIGMDTWALVVRHVFHLPVSDWAMIGRWVGYFPRGRFTHAPIAASAPLPHELATGWIVHYLTGVIYGLLYLGLVESLFDTAPGLASATGFGLCTLAAPWLLMQPGLGLGFFAAKTPRPWLTRTINVSMHLSFALAMYLGWVLLQMLQGA